MGNRKAGFLLAVVTGFYLMHRFGHRRGVTNDEVGRSLPGDELIPNALDETNHAVTINAPPTDIWPWLIQAGYHRGGWYSDSALDKWLFKYLWQRIAPPGKKPEYRPSADSILPEYQQLEVGDIVPDGPPDTAYFIVKEIQEFHHIILHSNTHHRPLTPGFLKATRFETDGEFTWVFVLREVSPRKTRLILRMRLNIKPFGSYILFWPFLMAGEAVFPHRVLSGIKERVERTAADAR